MLAWREARSPAQKRARIIDVPEYLAPGIYVEETGYRSKAIEGVSTSTRGFPGFVLGVLLGVAVSLAVGRARRRRRRRVPPTPG
jgi:ABC-type nitrate/sulfonate/bicarbonate transport system permease component